MMTRLRTFARSVALMAVLLAQLAMAQHFTVHFMERDGGALSVTASADGKSTPAQTSDKDDLCQICLSEKAAHALGQGIVILPAVFTAPSFSAALYSDPSFHWPQSYYSRGPPALS